MFAENRFDLLFTHPAEPLYIAKEKVGAKGRVDVSDDFYTEREQELHKEIEKDKQSNTTTNVDVATGSRKHHPTKKVTLKDFTVPNIEYIKAVVAHDDLFSIFLPLHRRIASRLIDLLYHAETIEKLQTFALYCRDRVNPALLNYALSLVLLHRKDTQTVLTPSLAEVFPDRFFESSVFQDAREQLEYVPEGSRVGISSHIIVVIINDEITTI